MISVLLPSHLPHRWCTNCPYLFSLWVFANITSVYPWPPSSILKANTIKSEQPVFSNAPQAWRPVHFLISKTREDGTFGGRSRSTVELLLNSCFVSCMPRLAGSTADQFTLSGYACKECLLFVPALGLQPSTPFKNLSHTLVHAPPLLPPFSTLSNGSPLLPMWCPQIAITKKGGQNRTDKHPFKKQVSTTFLWSSISNGDPLTLWWLR